MSDILIAQEVGTVVVIETAPAEIVEVVAVGPQGPVGDVNPQMPVILAATEAARDAALASEQAASASQSAAATSAANAATSESNAATSAATATAQATASAGSAAAAQASATNAATSETNAANSATASANSATSSANSATAAQAAQTATESARDTTLATIGTAALKANNLSDLANAATARSNLGLGNVNNTSDANKPVSTATQAALDTKAPLSHVGATGAAHGVVTTSVAGFMSAADKTKLDGVAVSANNYTHPSGDGNLHVPATGTTNSGKVLKAGATAGSLGWGTLDKADVGLGSVDNTSDANKPVSAAAQAALNLKANAASPTTTGTLTHSGDIVLSGSGKRIIGDFSNATVADRVMFQTSAVGGNTTLSVIPNGTGTASGIGLYSKSDVTNSEFLTAYIATGSAAVINTDKTGTGTYLPMTFYTGGSERMRITAAGVIQDGAGVELGYKDVPDNAQTVSYTLALADRGKSIDFTGAAGQTITVPANAAVAFPVGSVVVVTNNSANTLSITITTDTLRQAGTSNTGARTLAAYGMATLRKVGTTTWFISGAGLS